MLKNENTSASHRFAHWPRRFQAAIIDSAIITITFLVFGNWVSGTDLSTLAKVGIVGGLILALEPGMVAFSGGSIGHHLMGLKIERAGSHKNLNPFSATIRFLIKNLLGLFSLIFMLTTKRHQSLHDIAVNSVVVATDKTLAKGYQALPERTEEAGFKYPSMLKRIAFIILYLFVEYIIFNGLVLLLASEQYLLNVQNMGSSTELIVIFIFSIVFFVVSIVIVTLGWRSQLWGCRRSRIKKS